MNTGGIYCMNFSNAGNFFWDGIAADLVDQGPKGCVFLRRTTNNGKRPNPIFFCVHLVYTHEWEWMFKAVIPKVITKRTFAFIFVRMYFSANDKIRVKRNTISILISITKTPSPKCTCKSKFAHAFGKRHNSS